jgi:hypothetical protein
MEPHVRRHLLQGHLGEYRPRTTKGTMGRGTKGKAAGDERARHYC